MRYPIGNPQSFGLKNNFYLFPRCFKVFNLGTSHVGAVQKQNQLKNLTFKPFADRVTGIPMKILGKTVNLEQEIVTILVQGELREKRHKTTLK